jgi:hypothetical protein
LHRPDFKGVAHEPDCKRRGSVVRGQRQPTLGANTKTRQGWGTVGGAGRMLLALVARPLP